MPTANDDLFAWVLMDPCFPPSEILLGWYDGSWEHRAYWGDDLIGEGTYPNGRIYMGPLPAAGQWVKLAVPAKTVGLTGRTITGMWFASMAGRVWFDRAGKTVGSVAQNLRQKPAVQYAELPSMASSGSSSPTRYFLYTPELNLLAETELTVNAAPAIQYEYIWFGGQPVGQVMTATNQILWYFDDHLGTPLLQTDASANVVWRAEHEPYGTIYKLRAGANPHQPLRFPGQEAEELDTGTNGATERSYNIFRWYRAGWGRYTQADPVTIPTVAQFYDGVDAREQWLLRLASPQMQHAYTYSLDDPTTYLDPDGAAPAPARGTPPARRRQATRSWYETRCVWQQLVRAYREGTASGLPGRTNGPQDAFRHCVGICLIKKNCSTFEAAVGGTLHEIFTSDPIDPRLMDLHNNAIGRRCGDLSCGCESCCMGAVRSHEAQWLEQSRWQP